MHWIHNGIAWPSWGTDVRKFSQTYLIQISFKWKRARVREVHMCFLCMPYIRMNITSPFRSLPAQHRWKHKLNVYWWTGNLNHFLSPNDGLRRNFFQTLHQLSLIVSIYIHIYRPSRPARPGILLAKFPSPCLTQPRYVRWKKVRANLTMKFSDLMIFLYFGAWNFIVI